MICICIVFSLQHTRSRIILINSLFSIVFTVNILINLQIQYLTCWSKSLFSVICGLTLLLSDEVLYDDVGHAVSVGIAVLIQAMNRAEDQLEEGDGAVLTA